MIEDNKSYSFSIGASYNECIQYFDNDIYNKQSLDYFGVPFETNIKWFKKSKKRFRIYGLIPLGKPTAFGGSMGF